MAGGCFHSLPPGTRLDLTTRVSQSAPLPHNLCACSQPVPPAAMEESGSEDDVPEGAVRFELEAGDIEAALAEDGVEIEAREDVDVSGLALVA